MKKGKSESKIMPQESLEDAYSLRYANRKREKVDLHTKQKILDIWWSEPISIRKLADYFGFESYYIRIKRHLTNKKKLLIFVFESHYIRIKFYYQ